MTGRERAAWNAAGILVSRGVVLVVGVLLVPFLIERLGKQEYGLFQFAQTFIVYLPLLALSAGTGVNRYLTAAVAREASGEVERTLSTAFVVLTAMAGLLFAAAAGIAWLLPSLTELGDAVGRTRGLLLLLAAALAVQTVAGVFRAPLFAREQLGEQNLIDTISTLARAAIIVTAFHAVGASILWIGVATLAGFLLQLGVEVAFARRALGGLPLSFARLDRRLGRELLGFGAVATAGGLFQAVLVSSDAFLIQGIHGLEGPALIAVYSVGAMWDPVIRGVMMQLTGLVLPRMTQMAAREDDAALRELTVLSVRYASALVVAPCVLLGVFADTFLALWVGAQLDADELEVATAVLRLVMASLFLDASMRTTFGVFFAQGRLAAPVAVGAFAAVGKLAASVVLATTFGWGLPGIAAGTVLAVVVSQGVVRPWLLRRAIGLAPGRLLLGGLGPAVAVGAALLGAALAVHAWLAPGGLVSLGACVAGLGLLWAALGWWWVVLPDDRARLRDTLGRIGNS